MGDLVEIAGRVAEDTESMLPDKHQVDGDCRSTHNGGPQAGTGDMRLSNGFHNGRSHVDDDDVIARSTKTSGGFASCPSGFGASVNLVVPGMGGEEADGKDDPKDDDDDDDHNNNGGHRNDDCDAGNDEDSDKQLLELMEFLQAPTDHVNKAAFLSDRPSAIVEGSLGHKIDKTTNSSSLLLSSDATVVIGDNRHPVVVTRNTNNSHAQIISPSSDYCHLEGPEEVESAVMDDADKTAGDSSFINCAVASGNDNCPASERGAVYSTKDDVEHRTASELCSRGSNPDKDENHSGGSSSSVDVVPTSFPSDPPALPSSSSNFHKTSKRRVGLENILQRRLLLAAKPVNHSSGDVGKCDASSDSDRADKSAASLCLNGSVQVLTDHPKSITILGNASNNSGRTIKEILQWNSKAATTEADPTLEEAEINLKKLNKRKCSSPHRIIKRTKKGEPASPTKEIQEDVPASKSLPVCTGARQSAVVSSPPSIDQIPRSASSQLSTLVPLASAPPSSIITITPDDPRVESAASKSKHLPVKSLRPLAPKSTAAVSTCSSGVATASRNSAAGPSNIIPIPFVQSTTNPSLVILVNKSGTDRTRFISARPFQLGHPPCQVSSVDQQKVIFPNNSSISNLIHTSLSPSSTQTQQQHCLQLQPRSCPAPSQQQRPQLKTVAPTETVSSGASKPMPNLKLLPRTQNTPSDSRQKGSSNSFTFSRHSLATWPSRSSSSLPPVDHKFFEPCQNKCIIGRYEAPPPKNLRLRGEGLGINTNVRHACSSCGCTYSSKEALEEHCERKSFLITFECACRSAGIQSKSTFYNFCSLSIFYRSHVLHHPYVAHSPINSFKVSILPEDQLPPEYFDLVKSNAASFSVDPARTKEASAPSVSAVATEISAREPKEGFAFACRECNKKFRLPQRIKQHFQNWNRVTVKSPGNSQKAAADAVPAAHLSSSCHECSQCKIVLPNLCSLKAHSRIHSSAEPFVCPECGLTFSTVEVMKEHVDKVCFHNCRRAVIKGCRFCNFIPDGSSPFAESLDAHIACTHKRVFVKCTCCSDILKDEASLQKHSQADHGTTNSEGVPATRCPVCETVLTSSFDKHLATHDVDNKSRTYFFRCAECSECFIYRAELEKHLRDSGHLQTGASGFVCKLCKLVYPTREERRDHINAEHPELKEMFFDELNGLEGFPLPILNTKVHPGAGNFPELCRLNFKSKQMPPLRLISSSSISTTSSHAAVTSTGTDDCVGTSSRVALSTCTTVSASTAGVKRRRSVSSGDQSSSEIVTPSSPAAPKTPERWECSRCNEIFLKEAAFARHQRKHKFLEENKSRRKKIATSIVATSPIAGGPLSYASATLKVASTESSATLLASCSETADVAIGAISDADPMTPSTAVRTDLKLKDEGNNDDDDCGVTTEGKDLSKSTTANYEILPRLLETALSPEICNKEDSAGEVHTFPKCRWHPCQLCNMSFKSSEQLQQHNVSQHIGLQLVKPTTFSCSYCSSAEQSKRSFPSIRHLHKHLRMKHKVIRNKAGHYVGLDAPYRQGEGHHGLQNHPVSNPEVKESSDAKSVDQLPASPTSDEQDQTSCDDSVLVSKVQEESTVDEGSVRMRRIFGSPESPYACSYCDYSETDRSSFWEHVVASHDENFFEASVSLGHSTFQCPECGSAFVVRTALFRHLRLVHNVVEEEDYEAELGHFEDFKMQFSERLSLRSLNDARPQPKSFQDLPKEKLAKLASLRPEDIHNGSFSTSSSTFSSLDTPEDPLSSRRQRLRSQLKCGQSEGSLASSSISPASDCAVLTSQNECNVCYKTFDNQVDLRVHMRVHGMAFIQGTRRSLTTAVAVESPTDEKAAVA